MGHFTGRRFVFGLALMVLWTGPSTGQSPKEDPFKKKLPELLRASRLEANPKDDELQKLLKERYNEALAELEARYRVYMSGAGLVTFESLVDAGRRVVTAGLEAREDQADKIEFLSKNLELAREVEKIMEKQQKAGAATLDQVHRARYLRLDAEIELLRARRAAEKAKGK